MKTLRIILIGLLIASCASNLTVTETEKQSVEKVLDFYGGLCNRSKGFSTKDGAKETYFELEMSDSQLLESYSNMPELPASNIAYIFYSNLNTEKDNYTDIKVKVKFKNGQSHEYSYKVGDLKEIESTIGLISTVSDKIKKKEFIDVLNLFDDKIKENLDTLKLRLYCSPYDSAYGEIKQSQFQGFSFFESKKDNRLLIHLAAITIREKENVPLSLFVDRKTKKVVTLKYKL